MSDSAKLGPCCFAGKIATGTPKGSVGQLGSRPAYIARPRQTTTRAVVIATDVFGYALPNVRLIADSFAEAGFFCVVPDIFGSTHAPFFMLEAILGILLPSAKATIWDKIWSVVQGIFTIPFIIRFLIYNRHPSKHFHVYEKVIRELRKSHGIEHVGIVGYCYGGAPCFNFAQKQGLIDAFATAHTTVKVPDTIAPLIQPGLFICADKDRSFPEKEVKSAEEFVKTKTEKYVFKFYPGTYHGFAIRGHDDNGVIQSAKEDAFKQMVEFFSEHLN
eukprot:TRINITY_DN4728_c0_g1_i2.p1 TRINITY_DN4728_c0_g1~~TRINITY_DN4728_c0_g1_i2.p1  ORF type:complete len:274 (-),score=73.74 TRINITY_DN4728_c0_g1_i2:855-1676(-)